MRAVRVVCCVAALVACFALRAGADELNKLTYLTFSAPVEVPGAVLAAGTYTFKLADASGNRHIVQILDKAGRKPIVMIMTLPDQRPELSDKPVVMFTERPSGAPPAVKAWFYPGTTLGDEFIYPRQQAMRIAKVAHRQVLSMADASAADPERMKSVEIGRVDESGKVTEASTPSLENRIADNRTPGANGTAGQTRHTRTALPRTASDLELFELVSALSFGMAFTVRRFRSRFNS
jgi:hypothetical protein